MQVGLVSYLIELLGSTNLKRYANAMDAREGFAAAGESVGGRIHSIKIPE